MAKGGSLGSILIRAAIFIILEIAALAMLKSSSPLQDIWINRSSRRVQAFLWGGGENIRYFFSLKKTNKDLALVNATLNEELRKYRADGQTEFEKADTAFKEFLFIPASVVKMSRNSEHNYIILDKGSLDGIVPHCGIISDYGVIGVIESVSRHYSYGITLMNSNISVSSRIGRSGTTGPMAWDGLSSGSAFVRDIPTHFIAEPGDTVYTSGFSTLFPSDIPLGTVVESKSFDGATNRIKVSLFQDFSTLKFVTIVTKPGLKEIEELENHVIEEAEK